PSTYAPTINLIIKRNYVNREKRSLIPTELGMTVNKFMVKNFVTLLDYGFTAQMEKQLDDIESGKVDWVSLIDQFYKDYIEQIKIADKNNNKIEIVTDEICEKCGKPMILKSGKYGDFLGCSGYPQCDFTKRIVDDTGFKCPKCSGKVLNKKTKSGIKFISCENYPKCDFSSWGTIIKDKKCPKCSNFLLKVYEEKQALIRCSSDKCDYVTKFVKVTKKGEKDQEQ
ncbi:MAG: topoisomerase DNA-binding C4 zinc finger domain-containing protein, partial [Clostridia bacterium]